MESPGSRVADQVNRLNRLSGQIGGIGRMIEEERSILDILTQFKAVRSALDVVEESVVRTALRDGIDRALRSGDRESVIASLEALFLKQLQQLRSQQLRSQRRRTP